MARFLADKTTMPTVSISFNFASGKAGLSTVGYEVFDGQWMSQGPRKQTGIHESGSGVYTLSLPVVDGFVGFVRGDTGEANPRFDTVPVNFELPLATAPPLYDSPPVFRVADPLQVTFTSAEAPVVPPTPVPLEVVVTPVFRAGDVSVINFQGGDVPIGSVPNASDLEVVFVPPISPIFSPG